MASLIPAALVLALCAPTAAAATSSAGGGRVAAPPSLKRAPTCQTVAACRQAIRWHEAIEAHQAVDLRRKFVPLVRSAVRLASNESGVSYAGLWTLTGCETGHTYDPFSVNGQYRGLTQLGRYHRSLPDMAGLSAFDPYVAEMHAAMFIRLHGDTQWSCRMDGSVHSEG